jgi:hypothetical protein
MGARRAPRGSQAHRGLHYIELGADHSFDDDIDLRVALVSAGEAWALQVTLLVLLIAAVPNFHAGPAAAAWLMSITFGIVALTVAALVNQRTLPRSCAIYRPAKSSMGFAQ